jgi:hypothetical protein
MLSLAVAMILVLWLMRDPPELALVHLGVRLRRAADDALEFFGLFSFFGGVPKPTADTTWSVTGTKTEPSAGQKDAGWVVGQKPPAQWLNWWQNAVYQWILWLSVFELQAHTWTDQQTFTAGVNTGPLIADATVGGGNATGGLGLGSGTGSGFTGVGGATGPGLLGIGGATSGVGVHGETAAGSITSEPGVLGIYKGAANGAGVEGQNTTGGDGVLGTGKSAMGFNYSGVRGRADGVNSEAGVVGESGFGLIPGVLGKAGNAAGAVGIKGISGGVSNFAAVWGLSTHAGVFGVYGSASTGAEAGVYGATGGVSNTAAVQGVSSHDGVPGVKGFAHGSTGEAGVHGSGSGASGYGVIAEGKNAAPVRAALRIVPQSAQPTTGQKGDLYVDNTGIIWLHNGITWVKPSSQ